MRERGRNDFSLSREEERRVRERGKREREQEMRREGEDGKDEFSSSSPLCAQERRKERERGERGREEEFSWRQKNFCPEKMLGERESEARR